MLLCYRKFGNYRKMYRTKQKSTPLSLHREEQQACLDVDALCGESKSGQFASSFSFMLFSVSPSLSWFSQPRPWVTWATAKNNHQANISSPCPLTYFLNTLDYSLLLYVERNENGLFRWTFPPVDPRPGWEERVRITFWNLDKALRTPLPLWLPVLL